MKSLIVWESRPEDCCSCLDTSLAPGSEYILSQRTRIDSDGAEYMMPSCSHMHCLSTDHTTSNYSANHSLPTSLLHSWCPHLRAKWHHVLELGLFFWTSMYGYCHGWYHLYIQGEADIMRNSFKVTCKIILKVNAWKERLGGQRSQWLRWDLRNWTKPRMDRERPYGEPTGTFPRKSSVLSCARHYVGWPYVLVGLGYLPYMLVV